MKQDWTAERLLYVGKAISLVLVIGAVLVGLAPAHVVDFALILEWLSALVWLVSCPVLCFFYLVSSAAVPLLEAA